jgi:hypothetical protein
MPRKASFGCRVAILSLLPLIVCVRSFALAPVEKVVYDFFRSPDGAFPNAGLVADASGDLYGTTGWGGTGSACQNNCGTVFELIPPAIAGGAWTETVLYSFKGGANDGASPLGALILDHHGNLYGTTNVGGPDNVGSVFELSPPSTSAGAWTETVLLFFSQTGGANPFGKLVMDAAGNLYGTTQKGGAIKNEHWGTVFELIPPPVAGGAWVERLLYNFGAYVGDGVNPGPDLLLRGGVLYGTTTGGGTGTLFGGLGTVFQLVRKPGLWTETILHDFIGGADGCGPMGGLIADSAGNLFGTSFTNGGCTYSSGGLIYELSPPAMAGDPWQETILYNFLGKSDGFHPTAALWRDNLNDLFGTTNASAGASGGGAVFKLKPPAVAGGVWTLVPLHDFPSPMGDGLNPNCTLILVHGVFYGTAQRGGSKSKGAGMVFSVNP